MKVIFEEIIKGNLPNKEEKEFTVIKGKKHYFVYKNGNPSRDQIMRFNSVDANSEGQEERCKSIFEFFRYCLNEETRKWEQIK